MNEQTSISREKASTLLSELKSLYAGMPSEMQEAVKQLITLASPGDVAHSISQGA